MTKNIAGTTVEVDDEGFLTNPKQWTKEIASALAQEDGINLQDQHWRVIEFVRKDAAENGSAPNVRRLTKVGGFATKDLYAWFPKGPAKMAAKFSGYGKPHGCI